MIDLTRKDKGMGAQDEECDHSFKKLKEALMNAPVLVAPNWEKSFMLHVDASQFAVGGTLTQEDGEGRIRVIAYTSKKLSPAERNN